MAFYPTEADSKPSVRFKEFRLRHSLLLVRSNSLTDHSPARRTHSLLPNCVVRLRNDAMSSSRYSWSCCPQTAAAKISEMNQTEKVQASESALAPRLACGHLAERVCRLDQLI